MSYSAFDLERTLMYM